MHEEQRLGNFPSCTGHNARLPFGAPAASASTQGLHLCTDGDVLLGQAENGARAYQFNALERHGQLHLLGTLHLLITLAGSSCASSGTPGACWLRASCGQNNVQHRMLT